VTYQDAQAKLLAYVRDRIQNGELTERGLARLIGISQPHVHNVLKGARNLSAEIFDALLEHFQMSLLDLAGAKELEANLLRRRALERSAEVAMLAGVVGPGAAWPAGVERRRRFPLPFRSLAAPSELVIARLAADPDMRRTLSGADIALLDTSELQRCEITPDGLYAVSLGGEGLLRFIRPGADCYYVAADSNFDQPVRWREFGRTLAELLEVVKARVRWLGRERDRNLPLDQRGRFLYDPISR
jgi:transcriptional regulator with XRE-family HTH domain